MTAVRVPVLLMTLVALTGAHAGSPARRIDVPPDQGTHPALTFQVLFSEPLAVLEFVRSLSSKRPDNPFKTLFNGSRFNREPYTTLLTKFDACPFAYEYEFSEYKGTGKNSGSTEYVLEHNLINSRTFEEFTRSSFGVIPTVNLLQLSATLAEFQPVYEELVYGPAKDGFERQLHDIEALIRSTNMTAYFDVGLTFYNSFWDTSVPFQFVFYPLPNARGYTATAFGNDAVSALPTSLTDFNGVLSVMFHETFHLLYDEESLSLKKELVEWFASNPARSRHYAQGLLNEALATALANGYVATKLNGNENEGNWYRGKYINLMAKRIYPVVTEYVAASRAIDKAFVDRYLALYDETWLLDPANVLAGRFVLSDNGNDFDVVDRKFPVRPEVQYEQGITESAIGKMAEAGLTKLVIVSSNNKAKLAQIKRAFAELKRWEPDATSDFTYAVLLSDKTYLIVINSIHKTTEQQLDALTLR